MPDQTTATLTAYECYKEAAEAIRRNDIVASDQWRALGDSLDRHSYVPNAK